MTNSAIKKTTQPAKTEAVLYSIFQKAEVEYRQIEMMFELLGWDDLPGELKIEIEEDVKGYIDELNGRYSTACPFVQRRRESVDFWINSFRDGLCTAATAADALRVRKL